MGEVNADTTLEELAAVVSSALQEADIDAVLGGGGAVAIYSTGEYMSKDLDFVTSERNANIAPVMEPLGFTLQGRQFIHPTARYFIEFPPGPLAFGDRYVENDATTYFQTQWGAIRIITPTQSVMDRIAWFVHGNDAQSRAQAILVARHQNVDWEAVNEWADADGIDGAVIDAIRAQVENNRQS